MGGATPTANKVETFWFEAEVNVDPLFIVQWEIGAWSTKHLLPRAYIMYTAVRTHAHNGKSCVTLLICDISGLCI